MAKRVKFDDVMQIEKLFKLLSVEDSSGGTACPFQEWEILRELDRQQHRREYDKSPERQEQKRKLREQYRQVRVYMKEHPEVVERLKGKVKS